MIRLGLLAVLLLGAGCERSRCSFRTCDIRQAECQQALAEVAACVREREPVAFSVRVISQEQAVAEAVESAAASSDQSEFADEVRALAMLGLAPPTLSPEGAAEQRARTVAAYYRRATKEVTVVDQGQPLDSFPSCSMFIHESAHALQDQAVELAQLSKTFATTFDRSLSLAALIEGEAILVQDLATLAFYGVEADQPNWPEVFESWQSFEWASNSNSDLPLHLASRYFPYAYGADSVLRQWQGGGWPSVDALYARPRLSSREWMFPSDALEASGGAGDEPLGSDAVPVLPAGFGPVEDDELGAWVVGLFLDRADQGSLTNQVALNLKGDAFSIQRHGASGDLVVAWRLRLASESLAARAAESLSRLDRWSVWSSNRDVVLMASTNPELRPSFGPWLSFTSRP